MNILIPKQNILQKQSIDQFLSTMIMEDEITKEAFGNNSANDLLYGIISLFLVDYAYDINKRE